MRWTSAVVNSRVVVFPRAIARWKAISRWLTTWWSPHMKAITVLLCRNYRKMYTTWMFCVVEDTNIISSFSATSEADTVYTSGASEFTPPPPPPPVISGIRVTRSLVLCVCFIYRCLSFCTFSFGHRVRWLNELGSWTT